jgi:hypothetical protein
LVDSDNICEVVVDNNSLYISVVESFFGPHELPVSLPKNIDVDFEHDQAKPSYADIILLLHFFKR